MAARAAGCPHDRACGDGEDAQREDGGPDHAQPSPVGPLAERVAKDLRARPDVELGLALLLSSEVERRTMGCDP